MRQNLVVECIFIELQLVVQGFHLAWELSFLVSPVTMGFLHTTSGGGALTSSLCGQLLTWGFASSGLTGGLLGTGHDLLKIT